MSLKRNKLDKNCVFHIAVLRFCLTLLWHHNGRDCVSNHQRHDCLLSRLFRHRSKKTSKPRATRRCEWNSPVTSEFPHKGPVTRKMFPFDDVIMSSRLHARVFSCIFAITLNAWKSFYNTTTYICRSMLLRCWHAIHIIIWYWKNTCSGINFDDDGVPLHHKTFKQE